MKLIEEHQVFDNGQWHDITPLDLKTSVPSWVFFKASDLHWPEVSPVATDTYNPEDAPHDVKGVLAINTASDLYRCEKVAYAWVSSDGEFIEWANGPDNYDPTENDAPSNARAQLYKVTPV